MNLAASKLPVETISLDSRRVFGKANLDGELPGDPNADASNNNFQPWVFKGGGHFVGNMPYGSSHDQSGTARTQLRLTSALPGTDYVASCLTLFNTGTRGSTPAGSIGLYKPYVATPGTSYSDDPNLNTGLLTIWGNKWNIAPGTGTVPPEPSPIDFTTTPVFTLSPQSTDASNYLNWQVPYRSAITTTRYMGNGNASDVANNFWKYFAICSNNEAIPGQQFPMNDSRPRLWWIGVPGAQ